VEELSVFRLIFFCFSSIETTKLTVSVKKRNNRNKRFVLDSAETCFGSIFGCFESKLVLLDTLLPTVLYLRVPRTGTSTDTSSIPPPISMSCSHILYLNHRSQGEHPEDGEGIGGGHQDAGGRRRLLARAAGCRRSERRCHHRSAVRCGESRGRQPGLTEPGGAG